MNSVKKNEDGTIPFMAEKHDGQTVNSIPKYKE